MRTINQIFYDNIGKICTERGISIKKFCKESGIARSLYYAYGANEHTATLNIVKRASDTLGVSIGELLEENAK